jgi:hypothetical protein
MIVIYYYHIPKCAGSYVTKLFRGSFIIYDSEIRNNIEKEGLESTQL